MQKDGLLSRLNRLVLSWYGLATLALIILASAGLLFAILRDGDGSESQVTAVTPTVTSSPTSTIVPVRGSPSPDVISEPSPQVTTSPPSNHLQSGDVIYDSLENAGEVDKWTFEGTQGEFIELRADRDPTGNVRPRIDVRDPFGERVAVESAVSADYVILEYRLESTGVFTASLQDSVGTRLGKYELTFFINPFTEVVPDTIIPSDLRKPGEKDRYTFYGEAGDVVDVRVDRDPAGNVRPYIELWDPFGEREGVDSAVTQGFAQLEERIEDTGTFTVVLRDVRGDGVGKYTIRIALR